MLLVCWTMTRVPTATDASCLLGRNLQVDWLIMQRRHERQGRALRELQVTYLVNMIGVGGSALQEDGGDPDVDERAMSSE